MSQPAEDRSDDIVGAGDVDGSGGRVNRPEIKKGKRVSLFRFRKRRRKGVGNPSSPPSAGCLGKRVGGGGGGGCVYCCFKQTPTLDSPVEPQTSDPNSPNFTFELLRALVEKNDFYSKECNPHFDIAETDEN